MDKTLRQAIRDAAKDCDLSLVDRVKLRVVMRRRPDALERELYNQLQVEGIVPLTVSLDDVDVEGEIDWQALAEFIKEVLPAVLQIISLFL